MDCRSPAASTEEGWTFPGPKQQSLREIAGACEAAACDAVASAPSSRDAGGREVEEAGCGGWDACQAGQRGGMRKERSDRPFYPSGPCRAAVRGRCEDGVRKVRGRDEEGTRHERQARPVPLAI